MCFSSIHPERCIRGVCLHITLRWIRRTTWPGIFKQEPKRTIHATRPTFLRRHGARKRAQEERGTAICADNSYFTITFVIYVKTERGVKWLVKCFLKIPALLRAELSKAFSHEAGRRQNGLNQKNMDGSETHSRGHDSFIPATSASHPSVQCK